MATKINTKFETKDVAVKPAGALARLIGSDNVKRDKRVRQKLEDRLKEVDVAFSSLTKEEKVECRRVVESYLNGKISDIAKDVETPEAAAVIRANALQPLRELFASAGGITAKRGDQLVDDLAVSIGSGDGAVMPTWDAFLMDARRCHREWEISGNSPDPAFKGRPYEGMCMPAYQLLRNALEQGDDVLVRRAKATYEDARKKDGQDTIVVKLAIAALFVEAMKREAFDADRREAEAIEAGAGAARETERRRNIKRAQRGHGGFIAEAIGVERAMDNVSKKVDVLADKVDVQAAAEKVAAGMDNVGDKFDSGTGQLSDVANDLSRFLAKMEAVMDAAAEKFGILLDEDTKTADADI